MPVLPVIVLNCTRQMVPNILYSSVNNDIVLETTVEDKIYKYTVREYSNAKNARELQNIIGRPSTQDLIKYVERNLILNCPVTRQDILRTDNIFGHNIGSLKGNTIRTAQKHIEINIQDIPQDIMEKHIHVTMTVDLMFINRILFVMTTTRNIHFGMAKLVKDMKNNTLVTSIEQVMPAYQSRGFKIQAILGDGQLKHIKQIIEEKATNEYFCGK